MTDPQTRTIALNGVPYRIAADTAGRKTYQRSYRASNATDPGRIRRVEWQLGGEVTNVPVGAIGNSSQAASGYLSTDFARNLETRWDRRLISAGKQTAVDLTPFDPPGDIAYFDTAYFDTAYFAGAGSGTGGDGPDVVAFAEQNGYLLVVRGALLTQVDMSTDPWTVVSTTVMDADGLDADHWRGNAYVALGPTAPMQRVVGANSSGVMLQDVTAVSPAGDVYASAIKRGSDRAWYINAFQNTDPILGVVAQNYAQFTLDRFETLAAPFQVGDPDVGANGIGPWGAFTQFGQADGIYSFTDQGKPIPQSRALYSIHSSLNGKQFADPGWGWNYYTSITGMRANLGGTDNPIGIGEAMRDFTGHNGLAHAVYQARGELLAVYHTEADADYGYRCSFGPETGGTGQPLMFPWFYDGDGHCHAVYASTSHVPDAQGLWLVRANGTNLTYELVAANGRDDLYGEYEYSTDGGTWYGTTLDTDANLLKTLRLARFWTQGLTTGSSWELGFAFDSNPATPVGATYVSLGAVTSNGFQTVVPNDGGANGQGNATPTANISGRTMKPRFVQVAAGMGAETTPPEVRGTLEVEYDERPDFIEVVEVVIEVDDTPPTFFKVWNDILTLISEQTAQPVRIQLPDDLTPAGGAGQKYAMLAGTPTRQDVKQDGVAGIALTLHVWPRGSVLT